MKLELRRHDDSPARQPAAGGACGLNMLLSYAGWRESNFAQQLPPLLNPLGIDCFHAGSGAEATRVISEKKIHIAVVDLGMPMDEASSNRQPAGPRVLQVLRRLDEPPPTIVVRPHEPARRTNGRILSEALREGAFTVLERPVGVESMLEVLQKVVRRHYLNHWPAA